jgi:hypothetical protein
MRAALFGNIAADSEFMGALTETAIFSQWLHSSITDSLHYARWDGGEVDIVFLGSARQKPNWLVEIKWSDQPAKDQSLLDNCASFIKKNDMSPSALVTTRTIDSKINYRGVDFRLRPSSAYAYTVGANILSGKGSSSNPATTPFTATPSDLP